MSSAAKVSVDSFVRAESNRMLAGLMAASGSTSLSGLFGGMMKSGSDRGSGPWE